MKNRKLRAAGFTLVELAIVLVIGGLMMTAGTVMLKNYLLSSRMALTQSRMQDIDNAIQQYLSINGKLPCPASLTVAPGVAGYGASITDGTVTDCFAQASTAAGAGTFPIAGSLPPTAPALSPNVVIGAVPALSLNLPDSEMSDAWGDRFVYAVTDTLTNAANYNATQGSIMLVDGSSNPLVGPLASAGSPFAQYVILSHGADHAGAYTAAGIAGGVACPAAATALEYTNCTFTAAPITFRKTMLTSTKAGDTYFDDYVIFHAQSTSNALTSGMPSGMIAPFAPVPPAALATCPTGWMTPAAGGGCTAPLGGVCCQKE